MKQRSRSSHTWSLALAIAAMCAVAACAHSSVTGPGSGGGGGGSSFSSDLFVSATTGSDANAGTKKDPFATIDAAIAAADSGQTIVVAGGTYRETVGLRSGVTLEGGYNPSGWKRDTAQYPTVVDDSTMALYAYHVSDAVVDGFRLSTVRSSPYGVVTLDSSTAIEIRGSTISAAKGDDGQGGVNYGATPDGAAGQPGMAAGACTPSRVGGAGGNAQNAGWTGGTGGTGGYAGGFDGTSGAGATPGAGGKGGAAFYPGARGAAPPLVPNGLPGIGGFSFGAFHLSTGYSAAGGDSGEDGLDGSGGGGGGGGGGNPVLFTCGGGGGGGGQGGRGGAGGGGGSGGRASIGIVVGGTSQLQLDSSVVVTVGGGDGGIGGIGAVGGQGGAGGAGGAGASNGAAAGGQGGDGAEGGLGGQGGGGGGGPSIGVLLLRGGTFQSNGVTFHIGPPGAGGVSSSSSATGMRGDSAVVDTIG